MSLSAAALRKMLDMGLTLEQACELAEVWEEGASAPVPSTAALRQRRYRERQRNSDATRDATDDASPTLSLPPSPQTPQPPTHTRECVSTRERAAREEAAFGRFWAEYPRKVSKADARKAFAKAWRKLPPLDEEAILTGGLERAKAAWVDAQFIPHAATWLNGERWTDEPDPISPAKPHERPSRPDPRQAAYLDKLADIDAAMAAAFEPARERH